MNKLKDVLNRGRVALGTHISINDSVITEVIGSLGYDYLWIDTEHTPLSLDSVEKHLIAARAAGVAAVVRVPLNEPSRLKPILEMGPDGVIIPMVNSYEEAEQAVRACLYPPRGIRGYGPRHASRFGEIPMKEYLARVADDTMRIIQIEHIDAVNNLDKITKIPEIDAYIIGPCDLSASIGLLGEPDDDTRLEKVFREIISKVHAAGKPVGVSYGLCPDARIKCWIERGVDLISIASEMDFLLSGAKKLLGTMRNCARRE